MRIVESVLSPKPDNVNVKSSVLWSERNVRSLKLVPPPDAPKRSSTLSNVLEGTMNFVRKNVLSVNTLSLFAGITCMVAVVLAVWAIYMFKEQKNKMRNLQNMVVDMSLSEAKQRNGGVSNIRQTIETTPSSSLQKKQISVDNKLPVIDDKLQGMFHVPVSKQELMLNTQPVRNIPSDMEQMNELRKVQEEVAKLLTNPINIVMANMDTRSQSIDAPTSRVTIEDITNLEESSTQHMNGMVREATDQKRRFENMINFYSSQVQQDKESHINQFEEEDMDDDDDFLKDIELYAQEEKTMMEDMEQLQNDLQMVSM